MTFIHYSRLQLGFHIKLFSARLTRKVMVFIRAAFLRREKMQQDSVWFEK
jgi:hypothetical protein